MPGRNLRRHVVALALLVGAGALVVHPRGADAQVPAAPDSARAAAPDTAAVRRPAPRIASLAFEGHARVDSVRIARAFEVRVGQAYDPRALREGLLRLWGTNLFDDLEVRGRSEDGAVHLVLHVAERPRVARISFSGNDAKNEEDLKPHLGFREGESWRTRLLVTSRDSILAEYRREGYRDVEVKAIADSTAAGTWVQYEIQEGRKAQVTAVAFEGNHAFSADDLAGQLKSRKKGFPFRSGTVKEENLAEDLTRLRTFYRERGYRDVTVERLPLTAAAEGKGVVLAYRVNEGPFYRMGLVKWEGNQTVQTMALLTLPQPRPDGPYDGTRIREAVEGAYSLYAEEGYLYLQVEPVETIRDSNVVDVAFHIQEGPPSLVHQVKIAGNTYTKENVIRRELDLREGDLFRRSRLVNTQQNVFRLGYFEDVGVDFVPAESTDVDIVLRIKEKQTGTASAGAGYSSDGGLSGFVNLGHNNLFGNGQAVNIQLERGNTRRAVDVSFTDPWFRNTPMTLGGSMYYNERQVGSTDVVQYNEKRRGFSLSIGRPIPRLRYTRGLVRYRLEGTSIAIGNEAAASPSLRALATEGEQVTSGLEFSLSRNSTNHPYYPNRGQKGTASMELAGGPLGGDYDFNKIRVDSRWFARSPVPSWATMLRWRGGVLNSIGHDDTPLSVPLYERFRLGGVTFDGLRGYDDYEIVPEENLTFPRFESGQEVTPGTFARNPTPYPGGRVFTILTLEQQFLVVNPVHALLFAEAGNTWNRLGDATFDWKKSVGMGVRVEVPILGNVGFDYAYGFDRITPGWKGHFLFGAMFF